MFLLFGFLFKMFQQRKLGFVAKFFRFKRLYK